VHVTEPKAVRVSLPPDAVRREAFAEASLLRGEFYACLTARRDELFELADPVLCPDGAVKSPVDLTLLPEHRRGHGAMYGGLNHGRIDVDRLQRVLAGLPLPRFDAGRLVLAVDVSPWLRSDAPCAADRLFCRVYGRAKAASQFIPGWPCSFVAVLEPGATSWTAKAARVERGADQVDSRHLTFDPPGAPVSGQVSDDGARISTGSPRSWTGIPVSSWRTAGRAGCAWTTPSWP
jgi:hypothetical protein